MVLLIPLFTPPRMPSVVDEDGQTVETLVGHIAERTPQVVAEIEAMLPPGFPEHVANPVLRGLEREARRLGRG